MTLDRLILFVSAVCAAFFHVSAIMMQFFSIALSGVNGYLAVVKRKVISVKAAVVMVLAAWLVGSAGTLGMSAVSEIYLMPAGAPPLNCLCVL